MFNSAFYCSEWSGPCACSKTLDMKTHTGSQDVVVDVPCFIFNPKEGIDNPALSVNDDDGGTVAPRLVHLRRAEGQSFGFSLRQDGVSEVSAVQPWSPAEQSGLRLGDRVLEVNEENVCHKDFHWVVRRIQFCGGDLFLLVLRKEEYEQAVSLGLDIQFLVKASKGDLCFRPRLCHIRRDPALGLGFNLISLEGQRGRFIVSTVSGGPAERAGVCNGDKLIWFNGTRVSLLSQSALNKTIKRGQDSVTLLVIDKVSESCFIRRKMPIVPDVAECCAFPHRARTMNLTKGKDGYGFLLRQERLSISQRIVHVLREVDSGSPAQEAGMKDGDLLLAVNGEMVESLEHDDIVKLIRQSGDTVGLTALSKSGWDFYRELGISPLLFHEDPLDYNETTQQCRDALTAASEKTDVFL